MNHGRHQIMKILVSITFWNEKVKIISSRAQEIMNYPKEYMN